MMIKNQINKPKDLSSDSILEIIEMHFSGRYKKINRSGSRLDLKRLYKYKSNGREVIYKSMNFKDSCSFEVFDDFIIFNVSIIKQLIFWFSLLVFGLLVIWKVWNTPFLVSSALTIPIIIVVMTTNILSLKEFMKEELFIISKHLRV